MLALASLAFVGCSKDEITEVNQGDPIRFTANASKASRADVTTTTTINVDGSKFHVWAYYGDAEFMDGLATKSGDVWTYQTPKYWPNEGTVDFYAVHPTSIEDLATVSATSQTVNNFIVESEVAEQLDFIYAINLDEKKQDSAVPMNFRHALSQIVFAAKSGANSNLSVTIDGVSVHNIYGQGDYTFPELETIKQLDKDENAETENSDVVGIQDTYGTWALEGGSVKSFAAGITAATINPSDEKVLTTESAKAVADDPNTTEDETQAAVTSGALLLLPQGSDADRGALKAWDPATETVGTPATGSTKTKTTGTYFKISCKVRDDESKVYLYGGESNFGNVYIPVAIDWEQGKKYTYIFTFDNGAGYDEEGDEILVPIKFTVTVDEFQSEEDITVDM